MGDQRRHHTGADRAEGIRQLCGRLCNVRRCRRINRLRNQHGFDDRGRNHVGDRIDYGDVFTAASGLTGNIYPGEVISGTNVTTGTQIVSQVLPLLAGEALNGLGRYTVTFPEQTVASTAIAGTYGLLTVGGTITGTWGVGQTVTGSTTSAGTVITALLTGAGGAGTYVVNNAQTVGSFALASQSAIETKWFARSSGAAGESIKISSQS